MPDTVTVARPETVGGDRLGERPVRGQPVEDGFVGRHNADRPRRRAVSMDADSSLAVLDFGVETMGRSPVDESPATRGTAGNWRWTCDRRPDEAEDHENRQCHEHDRRESICVHQAPPPTQTPVRVSGKSGYF